jgi:hypothetical protein
MDATKNHGIGKRVKIVPQHWLRGSEIGQIVAFEQRGQNNWLIKFERQFPGGGIDGDKLWLSQREFVEAPEEDLSYSGANVHETKKHDFAPIELNGSLPHQFQASQAK